jgi:hypothetical protein
MGVVTVTHVDEATACHLLGVPLGAQRSQVEAAFRTEALRRHPDRGGEVEAFRRIVDARDTLLAASSMPGPSATEPPTSAEPASTEPTAGRTSPASQPPPTIGHAPAGPGLVYALTLMVLRRRNAWRAAERRRAEDGPTGL